MKSRSENAPPEVDPYSAIDLIGRLQRHNVEQLVKVPEVRALLTEMLSIRDERMRIAESLNVLPAAEVGKLFADYVSKDLEGCIQDLFDRVYDGLIHVIGTTIGRHLEQQNEKLEELKSAVLMVGLNPFGWLEVELVRDIRRFLQVQPGNQATVAKIFRHLAYDMKRPLPGANRIDKQEMIIKLMRRTECFREYHGFVFELQTVEFVEDGDQYASADSARTVLQQTVREVDSDDDDEETEEAKSSRHTKSKPVQVRKRNGKVLSKPPKSDAGV